MKTCAKCQSPTISSTTYLRDPEARKGNRRLIGRGLCSLCYYRARDDGTLVDHERPSLRRDELLDDYLMLRNQGHTARQIADRLGMNLEAFKRALIRAAKDGDPRAVHRPGGTW